MENIIQKTNKVQEQIKVELRSTLAKVIIMGEQLTALKESCGRGKWKPLFDENVITCSQSTARKYMKIAKWKDKVCESEDVASAYKKTTEIERGIRDARRAELWPLVLQKLSSDGTKSPVGWTKEHEKEYQRKWKEHEKDIEKEIPMVEYTYDMMQAVKFYEKMKKVKEGMKGNEEVIMLVEGCLSNIKDVSQKHEMCNSAIKYLRDKSIEYNRKAS